VFLMKKTEVKNLVRVYLQGGDNVIILTLMEKQKTEDALRGPSDIIRLWIPARRQDGDN
jgi:hypothetical protein